MVESSDTDKPKKDAVCTTCGKSVGASVSGSDGEWSFKPVCRCAIAKSVEADKQPARVGDSSEQKATEASSVKVQNVDDVEQVQPPPERSKADVESKSTGVKEPSAKIGESESPAKSESSAVAESHSASKSPAVPPSPVVSSEVDSGGWASVTSAKTASGPDLSKRPRAKTGESGSWKNAAAPRSFRDDNLSSSDSNDSWIEVASDDFAGPVPDDFNRPVAHEIHKMSTNGATSSGAHSSAKSLSSSGTNLGVSYSSSSNLDGSGASGAYRRGSSKTVEEPVDWVPVKQKPPDKTRSQFADDAELLDLTHKTETAEERAAKPDTRKAIQDALRRNRIKTMVVAAIALLLAYGVYSYADSKGLIKKVGILSQGANSGQQSKKGSGRHSKKNKRTK